jgi:tetratricopeptide (TPR) repeat protein
MSVFLGRAEAVSRLIEAYEAADARRPGPQQPEVVLVTGEAGMGKTTLLTVCGDTFAARGALVLRTTCWDSISTPALWPWVSVLSDLLTAQPELRGDTDLVPAELLDQLVSGSAGTRDGWDRMETDGSDRIRIFGAVERLLVRAARSGSLVIMLDDLQWADASTIDLLRFLVGSPMSNASLLFIGAYRPEELPEANSSSLSSLTSAARTVPLSGLTALQIQTMARQLLGPAATTQLSELIHARTDGHPFLSRELCQVAAAGGDISSVPTAARELIKRRLARLTPAAAGVLEGCSVLGASAFPEVIAEVVGDTRAEVIERLGEAVAAGAMAETGSSVEPARFIHDLYREAVYSGLPPARVSQLHAHAAAALLHRRDRGADVFPSELARHHVAAMPLTDLVAALEWASAAAEADAARCAFAEAADQLWRLRSAASASGLRWADPDLVGVLTFEADLRLRAGQADSARSLLTQAWALATASDAAELLGRVALSLDMIGARFAMPRPELVAALETARAGLAGSQTEVEVQVTAALARQLSHSVPKDRPRAVPLAERAVAVARTLDDPRTLASSLLAQHDSLWTPGLGQRRLRIAEEISELSERSGDAERHAQGLLLTTSAQLELSSPAFRATFATYAHVTARLRQPRHDYLLRTRQAALALVDGDLAAGEQLSAEAAELGERAGETDTGNVTMSQRLELVRAHGDPAELEATAEEAVRWWVGAPLHAHAVAAGFYARAGNLEKSRQQLGIVLALDESLTDRSYLWSIYVGELAMAAIATEDLVLTRRLVDDLRPIADGCAVNGAFVCFMGAHAHRLGLLSAHLGKITEAEQWLTQGLRIHRRLGARAWEAESSAALDQLAKSSAGAQTRPNSSGYLRRSGELWEASFDGQTVLLRDSKGLRDLAELLARPGVSVSALELSGSSLTDGDKSAGETLDHSALADYRRRLAELSRDIDEATEQGDLARRSAATDEREVLLAELRRSTRPDGSARSLGYATAERARKAVSLRIRDAIRRIEDALPALGRHLDRSVRTGNSCSYAPDG